jgi:hypothetical protein
VEALIRQNKVSGGMVLKLEACKRALSGGVRQVRIVGGCVPDGLLRAANGTKFPGTKVTPLFPARRARLPRRNADSLEAEREVINR